MRRRIPIRLLLGLLAMTAVAPLLIVVVVELTSSYQSARRNAQTLAQARAEAVRAELEAQITGIDLLLRSVGRMSRFTEAERDVNDQTLRAIKADLPVWVANIILLTPGGQTVGLAEGDSAGITPPLDREYFQRAVREQGLVAGVPARSRATGAAVIHLARPVNDGSGGITGIAAVSLHLDRFQELIDSTHLPHGSVITLLSGGGLVIARSEDAERWVGQDLHAHPLVRRTITEQRGTAEMEGIDGRQRLYVFSALEQVSWHLNAGIPRAAVFAPIRDDVLRQFVLLAVAMLLAAMGVTLTGRYITVPMAGASSAARALTGGAWSTRVPVSGPAEVQNLALALNRLAETTEARMGGIVGSAMDAIITIDDQQRVTVFNRAAEEMFGCTADEAIGGPLDRFLPAAARNLHRGHVDRFGATGVTRRSMGHLEPLTAVRADGTHFPIEATISQIEIDGRRLYTVILRDITERAQAEAERRELLDRERVARETAEASALRLRRLQSVTDAALSSLSLQALLDELPVRVREALEVDTVAVLLVDPEDGALLPRAIAGVHEPVDYSIRIPLGAGFAGRVAQERRPIIVDDVATVDLVQPEIRRAGLRSLLGVPLVTHGQVLGVLHAGSRGERQFTSEDTTLMTLAAERVAIAFENARLYEAEQAARAHAQHALSVRDEFLSAVSHELRTPLTSIAGFAQVLERRLERLDGPYRAALAEGLSTISVNARRMTELITDLLDVSRLQSGRILQLNLELLALDGLVDDLVSEARAAGHNFVLELPDEPLRGWFDRARLGRAISNVLANAVKYSPGGGMIMVSVTPSDDGQTATVTVADSGIGIPAADLPHVFERFRRGANVGGIWGAGIGLSLVRQIIEQHGGSVTITSVSEQGTTVAITLPLHAAPSA